MTSPFKPVDNLDRLLKSNTDGPRELKLDKLKLDRPLESVKSEFDFYTQVQKMTKTAPARSALVSSELRFEALDMDFGLIDFSSGDLVNETELTLRRARTLVDRQQYQEALSLLEPIIHDIPDHHEANYLKAFCYFFLFQVETALISLKTLRPLRLKSSLAKKVQNLKEEIRAEFTHIVLNEFSESFHNQDPLAIVKRMRYCVTLDPEEPIFYFLLAGSLLTADNLQEAFETTQEVQRKFKREDSLPVELLQIEIRRRQATQAMEPALKHFKKRKFRKAVDILSNQPKPIQNVPLFQAFRSYLNQCLTSSKIRPRSDVLPVPDGKPKEIEELHFFMIAEELSESNDLMEKEDFSESEKILRTALNYTPHFPFANFLYALSIFNRHIVTLERGGRPDLEVMLKDMHMAHDFAKIGIKDPELKQAVHLKEVLEIALKELEERQKERKRGEADNTMLREPFEEFRAIRESGKDGIKSEEQAKRLLARTSNLKRRLPLLQKQLHTEEAREAIKKLIEIVDSDISQLESLQKEIATASHVGMYFQRFNEAMQSISGGINTIEQLISLKAIMTDLESDIRKELRKVNEKEMRNALSKLLDAVKDVLNQTSL